jgi:hypothetical protein
VLVGYSLTWAIDAELGRRLVPAATVAEDAGRERRAVA